MDELNVSGRRTVFAVSEKICLQKLIIKHRLLSKHLTVASKRTAWAQLTQEFNSLKHNTPKTETQLRKCWDNIKTRRKQGLEKRGRLCSLGEDIHTPGADESSVKDPLMPVKQECTWTPGHDDSLSDTAMSSGSASPPPPETVERVIPDELFQTQTQGSKPSGRLQEREEELHKLRVAERIWHLKTLRERHATAQLVRERAQLERERAQFERDAAQLYRDKAQLDLERAKRTDDSHECGTKLKNNYLSEQC